MAYQSDPNALSTLLAGQYKPSRLGYSSQDEQLASMIPEEQLYQMQDAQGDAGRARGGPYAISSRDSLRQSGIAGLKQMLGLQQAEAQAKAYPSQVAGEYGIAREREHSSGNLAAARAKAEADAAQRQGQNEFQASQQGRQQEFQGGQNELMRKSLEGRNAAGIAGRSDVAGQATARTAATQKSIDARKNPQGPLDWLLGKITGSTSGNNAPAPISPKVAAAIQQGKADPSTANLSFQELEATGALAGASPADLAAFQQAWDGAQ